MGAAGHEGDGAAKSCGRNVYGPAELLSRVSELSGTPIQYRPAIDGLRALAVLSVMFFHAGFNRFTGGYVGVDIFFVISGYLITTIIYREIRSDTFSVVGFYERRVRRILPALILVSLVCIPFAWLWMMPAEFKDFSQSIAAVNLFSSNFLFWKESGYFAAATELKPLLHTWSLGVEEQFYILFPLILILLSKLGRKALLGALIVGTVSSLFISEWSSSTHPLANFYLLPTRAWELGVGAILAIIGDKWSSSNWVAEVGSTLGLGAIIYAVLKFDASVPFPSVWGLIPVLGTALLIVCARPPTLVGRFLSWPPLVGVGLVSYSAYLWHQPLFAFARLRLFGGVSPELYSGLCILALLLAFGSWVFVEQPFRNRAVLPRRHVFSSAFVAGVLLVSFGFAGHISGGFPSRLAAMTSDVLPVNYGLSQTCEDEFPLSPDCRTSDSPEVVVWGDSYAMHLVDGLIASNSDAALIQMTKSACGPFIDIAPVTAKYPIAWAKGCLTFNSQVRDWLRSSRSVRFAILSSAFFRYVNEETQVLYHNRVVKFPSFDFIVQRFKSTLAWLAQEKITPIVIAPPPTDGRDIGRCLVQAKALGLSTAACDIKIEKYEMHQKNVIAFLRQIQKEYKVIWLSDKMCSRNSCDSSVHDVIIYRDKGHLSHGGSRYLGKAMNLYDLVRADGNRRDIKWLR